MSLLAGLLLAAAVDGPAVLRHASALSALGPHPAGSPRARAAGEFVAAGLRDAGLADVRLVAFEGGPLRGANVVGTLPAAGSDFVVVVSHHDTPEDSPGAHESGAGAGLLVELARVFAKEPSRPRTLVFLSLDGGALPASASVPAAGAAYVAALGKEGKSLVGVLAVGPLGAKGSTAVLQSLGAGDARQLGAFFIAPGWWARAAMEGAAAGDAPPLLGDAGLLRFVYPAAVRAYRPGRVRGDDAAFLAAGHPGLWLTDWSPTAAYPWAGQPADTPDKLDADVLTAAGLIAQDSLRGLLQVRRGAAADSSWVVALGRVFGPLWLLGAGVLALLPALVGGLRAVGPLRFARLFLALLSALLLWRHPVVGLFVLGLPNLLAALGSFRLSLLGLAPAIVLAAVGVLGARRGLVSGVWLAPWEIAAFGLALALSLIPLRPAGTKRPAFIKKKTGPKRLPKETVRRW